MVGSLWLTHHNLEKKRHTSTGRENDISDRISAALIGLFQASFRAEFIIHSIDFRRIFPIM